MRRRDTLKLLLAPLGAPARANGAMPLPAKAAVADPQLSQALQNAGPAVRRVLADATFEPQILWTRFARDAHGQWQAKVTQQWGVQQQRWFAAASFIKLPVAALLGEVLCRRGLVNQINDLHLHVDRADACAPLPQGPSWPLASLLRAMLVVSDNRSYNALVELLGSDAVHARLAEIGYPDSRIGARLGCAAATRPGKLAARLTDSRGHLLWDSPAIPEEKPQPFPFGVAQKGRAWLQNGQLIAGPRDFTTSNFMPLNEVHRMTMELGSGSAPAENAFVLCPAMREWLRATMLMTPRQCADTRCGQWPDDHGKWLIASDAQGHLPASLDIASKNAQAFGYLGDSAFIVDNARNLAFGLSASIFVDRDGVLNDGRYAYTDIGRPFLRELGAAILAFERRAE